MSERRKPKICLFIGSLITGGSQRQILYLADGLHALGERVELLTVFPGGKFWDEAIAGKAGIVRSLYRSYPSNRLARLLFIAWAPFRLRRRIRRTRPDILYSMLHLSNLFARLAILELRRKPRLVWGIRATVIQRDWRIQWPYRLCKPLSGGVDSFIANSQAGLDYYRQDGFKIRRAKVVYNGIDTRRFQFDEAGRQALRARWSVPQEWVLVGMVARISMIKGHDLFFRMAHELLKSQTRMSFVCVGSGSASLRAGLDGLIDQLGISDAVRFLDDVSDVAAVLSAIDVVVLPSASEGFPNVIGEAMACGRPCVATDVGDVRTLLGSAGVVAPRGDHHALADGVNTVLKSPDKFGDAGRRRVESEFSIDKMVADSLEFLKRGTAS